MPRVRFKLDRICEELQDEVMLSFDQDEQFDGLYHGFCERGRCSIMFFLRQDAECTYRQMEKFAIKLLCSRCSYSLGTAPTGADNNK